MLQSTVAVSGGKQTTLQQESQQEKTGLVLTHIVQQEVTSWSDWNPQQSAQQTLYR